jgi:hypothetical protein
MSRHDRDDVGQDLFNFLSGVARSDAAFHHAKSSYDNAFDLAFERAEIERAREDALMQDAEEERV